ncbi:MAG: L,D-transpeptidase family protein [Bacteroidota bacterium]
MRRCPVVGGLPVCVALLCALFVLSTPSSAQELAAGPAPSSGVYAFPVPLLGGGTSASLPANVHPNDMVEGLNINLPVYYPTQREVVVYDAPGGQRIGQLEYRYAVQGLRRSGGFHYVRQGFVEGWVRTNELSNLWLKVSKEQRLLFVYEGHDLVRTMEIDVSMNPVDDKVRRSRLGEHEHYRIPEGTYFVTRLNGRSQYYRAFVINYPNSEDAQRGLRDGLITAQQYATIVRAEEEFREPPQNTALGGLIELHGNGSGNQRAWTRGCVALRNVHMDILWDLVMPGTPVVIEK